ncbi:MAG: ATP-binding protein [Marmoricola sp.]
MALTKRSLALPATPPAARQARAWVAEVLHEVGRSELVEAAQLGVSELVTNALLHAYAPVTVRVRGTRSHPLIEVSDRSPQPLRPTRLTAVSPDDEPSSFGRGLMIVAMNAEQWGSERSLDGSKVVWFEPSREPRERTDHLEVFRSFEEDDPAEAEDPVPDAITVQLLHLPARMFGHLRRYHYELRREMRLLAITDPERYPIAVAVTESFRQVDSERRTATGIRRLDDAIRQGELYVDLAYAVPPEAPRTMARALALTRECYRALADEHLGEMVPPPDLRALQRWYFLEFVRQGRGEPPLPWSPAAAEPRGSR